MKFVINMEYEIADEPSADIMREMSEWIKNDLDWWEGIYSYLRLSGNGFIGFLPESEDDNETST